MMKNVIYIGENIGTPDTAMFIHCQNVARIFKDIGYNVLFVSIGEKGQDNPHIYGENKYYYSIRRHSKGISRKLEHITEELSGNQFYKVFLQVAEENHPDLILYYGYSIEEKLLKYAHIKGVPFLVERVDWFEQSDHNKFFYKYIVQRKVDYSYSCLDLQADGIIAISDYLEKYFTSKQMKVVRIPPVFDTNTEMITEYKAENPISIVYCGSAGNKKDYYMPVVDALLFLNREELRYTLQIIGIPSDKISSKYDMKVLQKYGIFVYGKIGNEQARKIIHESDFSVLFRDPKRYAKAGFSTKFAESMVLGVPVICNSVGGADTVITNGVNGIVIDSRDKERIINILSEILTYDENHINQIKNQALDFANSFFNYFGYVDKLRAFIADITSGMKSNG